MKQALLLFCISFFPFAFPAQTNVYHPFPADSANWDVQHNDNYPAGWGCISTFHYAMLGDTVIGGQPYNKIYRNNTAFVVTDSSFNMATASYVAGLREDTVKRVWAVNAGDTAAKLLYDFSLAVGDSFSYPYFNGAIYYYVTAIDSMLVGSTYRKTIWLGAPGGSEQWIEGVGSTHGLFQRNELASWEDQLLCHSDHGDQLIGSTYCHCDHTVGEYEAVADAGTITVYPNPAQATLDVRFSGDGIYTCALFSVDGRMISGRVTFQHSVTLDVSACAAGLYELVVMDENGVVVKSVKVVKE